MSESATSLPVSLDTQELPLKIEIYRTFIAETVNSVKLLPHLKDLIDEDQYQHVSNLDKNKSSVASTTKLLEYLEISHQDGKWVTFIQALEKEGYVMISDILKGTEDLDLNVYRCQKKLIDVVFVVDLHKKINPLEICPKLIRLEVIDNEDYQNIEAMTRLYGNYTASMLLIDRIPRKRSSWYRDFLDVLYEDKPDLVLQIDPDYITGKSKWLCENDTCIDEDAMAKKLSDEDVIAKKLSDDEEDTKEGMIGDSTETMENYDSVRGPAQKSLDDTDVPKQDESINDLSTTCMKKKHSANFNLNQPDSIDKKHILYERKAGSIVSEFPKKVDEDVFDSDDDCNSNDRDETCVKNVENPSDDIGKSRSSNVTDKETNTDRDVLKLRSYQEELAESSLKGINSIIVAPTGCGKTFVAMKIIENHFKTFKARHPKVIFLTEQSALAQQQGDQIKKYLSDKKVKVITGETQQDDNWASLKVWLEKRNILVVTAQLLVNALLSKDVKIKDFSLMIFDECHHTNAKHAYNQIMFHFLNIKIEEEMSSLSLPQIVGLTASLGVGKARTLDKAVDWIKTIMANLDSENVSTVTEKYKQDLKKYSQIPKEEICEVPTRTEDRFRDEMVKLMRTIETTMQKSNYAALVPDHEDCLTTQSLKGSIQYEQWISNLRRIFAKLRDQEAKRFFQPCRIYLEILNKTLIIHDDSRVKDALDYLSVHLEECQSEHILDETEKTLKDQTNEIMPVLKSCMGIRNPKLEALEERIRRAFVKQEASRGIIFVKTRELASAIVSWMKETPYLCSLNPVKFVGTHVRGSEGLTKTEQDDILRLFREGNHKIIVATSVADEGLDIQECNLVIKYHQVTNEIVMVQRRGRARKRESEVVLFAEVGSKVAEKEELNMMRELMMSKAIEQLKYQMESNMREFMKEIRHIQRTCKTKRDNDVRNRNGRIQREGDFELQCCNCSKYICMSYDIRKIQGSHHAVVGEEIRQQISARRKKKSNYTDPLLTFGIGTVTCREETCKKELGSISIYKEAQFPILKISNFSVEDSMGKRDEFKRWKQVPFHVEDLSHEDLENQLTIPTFVDFN